MISGANDKELTLANARVDIILKLDNTSIYESWLIIDTYIEQIEKENQQLKEKLKLEENHSNVISKAYKNLEKNNLNFLEQLKQRDEVIEKVNQLLEFYYIGNLKYDELSQRAFKRILDLLNKCKGDNNEL